MGSRRGWREERRNVAHKHRIEPADILPVEDYAKVRDAERRRISARKRHRRVMVGPYVTFFFECYETMWQQVQEMLRIERGGEAQLAGELEAYNPLVPNGRELVATFMVEIDDPLRRHQVLADLGGIEETAFLRLGAETIRAVPEADLDRTTAAGKASSVQFVHFPFTPAQIERFRAPGAQVTLGLSHPRYSHMTVLADDVRAELAADFD
jgi:hypothetical protein